MNPADLKRKSAGNSTDDVVVAVLEEEQAQKRSKKAQQGPRTRKQVGQGGTTAAAWTMS